MIKEIELLVETLKDAHRVIRSLLVALDDLEDAINNERDCKAALTDVKKNFLDFARVILVPRFYAHWEAAAKSIDLNNEREESRNDLRI